MRYLLCAALAALLIVPAASARKPRQAAAVTGVTVTVTTPGGYHVDRPAGTLMSLYVLTHRCTVTDPNMPGGVSYVEYDYAALPWYTSADVSADVGPFPVAGESCEAFVWAWPDSVTAVSNTVTYAP